MKQLFIVVNNELVDLSFMSPYLKENIDEWIAEVYLYLIEKHNQTDNK